MRRPGAMSETETAPETQPEPAKEEEDGDKPTEPAYEPSGQLTALMEQYPDCIGYISIEGTKISYPIPCRMKIMNIIFIATWQVRNQ